eukprot:scaffold7997_cov126-Isochrysis_galbana.AAC.3
MRGFAIACGLAIANGMRMPALPCTLRPVARLFVLRGGELDDALPPAEPPSDMRLLEDGQATLSMICKPVSPPAP